MGQIRFTWDSDKDRENRKKHGITFEEAQDVFFDENAVLISDPEHSQNEERFVILGLSLKAKILTVCHCYRGENQDEIRIISAREATKDENLQYFSRLG